MWTSDTNLVTDYGQNNIVKNNKYTALKNGFKVIDANSNYYIFRL